MKKKRKEGAWPLMSEPSRESVTERLQKVIKEASGKKQTIKIYSPGDRDVGIGPTEVTVTIESNTADLESYALKELAKTLAELYDIESNYKFKIL